MTKTASQSDADSKKMSECAGSCGDMDSAIDCYDKYGTDDWEMCEGEGEGEDDGDDAE